MEQPNDPSIPPEDDGGFYSDGNIPDDNSELLPTYIGYSDDGSQLSDSPRLYKRGKGTEQQQKMRVRRKLNARYYHYCMKVAKKYDVPDVYKNYEICLDRLWRNY